MKIQKVYECQQCFTIHDDEWDAKHCCEPEIWAFLLPDFYIVHPQMVNGLGVKLVLVRLVVPVVFRLCFQSQASPYHLYNHLRQYARLLRA